jgi:preprotein translocase subunit SecE
MAKSVSDNTTSKAVPATTSKAPAKQSSGGIKNPFSRSSSAKQTAGPRGTVATKPQGRLRTFLREVRVEMSKVTWPPRKELITSTGVVLLAVVIAGVYIGVWDFIWNLIVRAVGLG